MIKIKQTSINTWWQKLLSSLIYSSNNKILKNIRNIVELAVKVEKSNCKSLHGRCKLVEINKLMLFRDFTC